MKLSLTRLSRLSRSLSLSWEYKMSSGYRMNMRSTRICSECPLRGVTVLLMCMSTYADACMNVCADAAYACCADPSGTYHTCISVLILPNMRRSSYWTYRSTAAWPDTSNCGYLKLHPLHMKISVDSWGSSFRYYLMLTFMISSYDIYCAMTE